MIYVLSFRDNERNAGGAVFGGQLQQWLPTGQVRVGYKLVTELATEPSVIFLIHGYNVDLGQGRRQLLNLAQMLRPHTAGGLVATLWPGDSRFLGPLSYPYEGADADDTAENLYRFIVDSLNPAIRISFVTHSLGARVAMGTIARLVGSAFTVDQVCLMAAAIDDDSLAHSRMYRRATEYSGRIAVLHSDRDRVLRFAYPGGDFLQCFISWRDSPGLALGYHGPVDAPGNGGPPPRNVIEEAVGHHNVDHDDYFPPVQGSPTAPQTRAAGFAGDVIAGRQSPAF